VQYAAFASSGTKVGTRCRPTWLTLEVRDDSRLSARRSLYGGVRRLEASIHHGVPESTLVPLLFSTMEKFHRLALGSSWTAKV